MNKTENDNTACAFLIFEIILGSILIHFPSGENGIEDIAATLAASLFAVPFAALLYKKSVQNKPLGVSPVKGAFALIICLYFIYACAKNYVGFCDNLMLPFTPNIVLCALIVVSAFMVSNIKAQALLKLAAAIGVLCLVFYIVVFLWLLSCAEVSLDFNGFSFKTAAKETVKVFAGSFGTLCILPIIIKGKNVSKKGVAAGVFMGAAALFSAATLVHFSLGAMAANLNAPLYAACGTVTIGEDFTKIDFLCLFNFFATAFIELSVLFFAAKEIIFSLFTKKQEAAFTLFCALAVFFTMLSGKLSFLVSFYALAALFVIEFLFVFIYP